MYNLSYSCFVCQQLSPTVISKKKNAPLRNRRFCQSYILLIYPCLDQIQRSLCLTHLDLSVCGSLLHCICLYQGQCTPIMLLRHNHRELSNVVSRKELQFRTDNLNM